MRRLFFFLFICSSIFACSDHDRNIGFSSDELSPLVTFTANNTQVKISNANGAFWTNSKAINEKGEQVPEKTAKGFGSVIDSGGNGRQQVTVTISRWVSQDDIDYVMPNIFFEVIDAGVFKSIFGAGKRLYARNGYQISTTDEVLIEYFDENATRWSTCYQGNYYSTPPYNELQPSSGFTITRSMPFGTDSVFVEATFKARLYKNETEYHVVDDGYFKGYFYRKPG